MCGSCAANKARFNKSQVGDNVQPITYPVKEKQTPVAIDTTEYNIVIPEAIPVSNKGRCIWCGNDRCCCAHKDRAF